MAWEIAGQLEADARNAAMHDTWGHLGPTRGEHPITLVFTQSIFGDIVLIDTDHPTLQESPWHHACMTEMVGELTDRDDIDQGAVYRFEGTCTYSHDHDAYEDDFKEMFERYDCESEWYTEDSQKKIAALKKSTTMDTPEEMLKQFHHHQLNEHLEKAGIEPIDAYNTLTMTHWTGTTEALTTRLSDK